MKAIAAVDSNWGIGYKGDLLAHIPEDMKFFKQTTLGKIVVMGRETFESLPGKQPLKGRINIVLTKNTKIDDVKICNSINELFEELEKYPTDDVFVIGGESIYNQLLPFCSEVFITKIEKEYKADKHFKNLDEDEAWKVIYEGEMQNYNDVKYRFVKYANVKG
ncbi:MAG: dihydrofolate reductase [Deltaproteobacteria bacterium]